MGKIVIGIPGTGIHTLKDDLPSMFTVKVFKNLDEALAWVDLDILGMAIAAIPWYEGFEKDAYASNRQVNVYYPVYDERELFVELCEEENRCTPEELEWLHNDMDRVLDDMVEWTNVQIIHQTVMMGNEQIRDYYYY